MSSNYRDSSRLASDCSIHAHDHGRFTSMQTQSSGNAKPLVYVSRKQD